MGHVWNGHEDSGAGTATPKPAGGHWEYGTPSRVPSVHVGLWPSKESVLLITTITTIIIITIITQTIKQEKSHKFKKKT